MVVLFEYSLRLRISNAISTICEHGYIVTIDCG
jgi:hypothetical protein